MTSLVSALGFILSLVTVLFHSDGKKGMYIFFVTK